MIHMKWQWAVLGPIAAFLLGLLWNAPNGTDESRMTHESQIIRLRLDTAHGLIGVSVAPIHLQAKVNRMRPITIHDSVCTERCLDTLLIADTSQIAPDTLSVCFAHNMFSVAVGLGTRRKSIDIPYMARDTFYSREDTIRIVSTDKRNWYDQVLAILVSVAAGIVIAKL
ncbi:MAG: hypothetical protein Q8922_04695 [Bacteroidota bacterium]|nr:hypothetical protein [Bacteroidota bacterium]MDP4231880.1 hypothetical protein [Bacteroidota bacterium]MDP4287217.1 hypothetical protein [Bacteroidota bacterium]